MSDIRSSRLDYLDSARGLAAICVLFGHVIDCYKLPAETTWHRDSLFYFFFNGEAAVSFFFVLSGFVLATSLNKIDFKFDLATYLSFCIKRFFRIYPLFWVALVFSLTVKIIYSHFDFYQYQSTFGSSLQNIPTNVTKAIWQFVLIHPNGWSNDSPLLPQDWTLRIEFIYSMVIPAWFILSKTNKLTMIVISILGTKLGIFPVWLFPMVLGVCFCSYRESICSSFQRLNMSIKYFILLGIFFLLGSRIFLPEPVFQFTTKCFINIFSLTGFLTLMIITSSMKAQKILNSKYLLFLGKISYGIYLTHLPIAFIICPFSLYYLSNWHIIDQFKIFLIISVVIAISIPLSYLLHIIIEKPFMKMGHNFTALILKSKEK